MSRYLPKQYELALRDYTKAIELDPKYANPYVGRGNVYRDQKQYDEALRDYTKAIELDPKFALAYYNRGLLYRYNLGDKATARKDFQRAASLGYESAKKELESL